ncbi:hypothetical protein M0G74_06415 [Microbulbifer sp. CAU 1566]|uniref:hypothetical protein n=1 Tax=Microbulbifer sp. CAU 1566 TaxID=2933269 RepID=UPI002005737C|nr:hypothetical protein [Microbulbifer sp. CAU 1566]MCK7596903.1 hypothetical protein [Microbulbifer sp. CAU 1566]
MTMKAITKETENYLAQHEAEAVERVQLTLERVEDTRRDLCGQFSDRSMAPAVMAHETAVVQHTKAIGDRERWAQQRAELAGGDRIDLEVESQVGATMQAIEGFVEVHHGIAIPEKIASQLECLLNQHRDELEDTVLTQGEDAALAD